MTARTVRSDMASREYLGETSESAVDSGFRKEAGLDRTRLRARSWRLRCAIFVYCRWQVPHCFGAIMPTQECRLLKQRGNGVLWWVLEEDSKWGHEHVGQWDQVGLGVKLR